MELFWSRDIAGGFVTLDAEESAHCVRVLRHREGDTISVIDGEGTLMTCELTDASPKAAVARIVSSEAGWGAHPYYLRMAVCPTKNAERYEWFAEKATELGVDEIVPVIGERSERKVFKTERLRRILLSAAKQSLKGAIPVVAEPAPLREFLLSLPDLASGSSSLADSSSLASCPSSLASCPSSLVSGSSARASSRDPLDLRLICYCFEGSAPRVSIMDALRAAVCRDVRTAETLPKGEILCFTNHMPDRRPTITILIGPEGDFSPEEAALAVAHGFIPVHLGPSRLRTETAALTAVHAVYLSTL